MSKRYSDTSRWIAHLMGRGVVVNRFPREMKRTTEQACGSICDIVRVTPLSTMYNNNLEDSYSGCDSLGGSDE